MSGNVELARGGEYSEVAWVTRDEAKELMGWRKSLWGKLKFVL